MIDDGSTDSVTSGASSSMVASGSVSTDPGTAVGSGPPDNAKTSTETSGTAGKDEKTTEMPTVEIDGGLLSPPIHEPRASFFKNPPVSKTGIGRLTYHLTDLPDLLVAEVRTSCLPGTSENGRNDNEDIIKHKKLRSKALKEALEQASGPISAFNTGTIQNTDKSFDHLVAVFFDITSVKQLKDYTVDLEHVRKIIKKPEIQDQSSESRLQCKIRPLTGKFPKQDAVNLYWKSFLTVLRKRASVKSNLATATASTQLSFKSFLPTARTPTGSVHTRVWSARLHQSLAMAFCLAFELFRRSIRSTIACIWTLTSFRTCLRAIFSRRCSKFSRRRNLSPMQLSTFPCCDSCWPVFRFDARIPAPRLRVRRRSFWMQIQCFRAERSALRTLRCRRMSLPSTLRAPHTPCGHSSRIGCGHRARP